MGQSLRQRAAGAGLRQSATCGEGTVPIFPPDRAHLGVGTVPFSPDTVFRGAAATTFFPSNRRGRSLPPPASVSFHTTPPWTYLVGAWETVSLTSSSKSVDVYHNTTSTVLVAASTSDVIDTRGSTGRPSPTLISIVRLGATMYPFLSATSCL